MYHIIQDFFFFFARLKIKISNGELHREIRNINILWSDKGIRVQIKLMARIIIRIIPCAHQNGEGRALDIESFVRNRKYSEWIGSDR